MKQISVDIVLMELRRKAQTRDEFIEIIRLSSCFSMLMRYFENDKKKVNLWMYTPNPAFGDIIPMELFYIGRIHKVQQFIKASLEGY